MLYCLNSVYILLNHLSSCSVSTEGFPRISSLADLIRSSPLSPLVCLSAKGTPLARSTFTGSCIARNLPPGLCAISPASSSSSSSVAIVRVSSMSSSDHCRLFRLQALPGSSASKTLLLVFSAPPLFCDKFLWFASCRTLKLFGELCSVHGVGHRRLSLTPLPCPQ